MNVKLFFINKLIILVNKSFNSLEQLIIVVIQLQYGF